MSLLEIENVSKAFGGLQAINKVSLNIKQGEIVGLIGPNGAGKSTLFDLISGLIKPDTGRIIFNGVDITGMPPHEICRSGIARTFQLVMPFQRITPLENIMVGSAYGSSPARNIKLARQEAEKLMAFTALANKRVRNAGMLGLVDRKRLEIARALATKPKLLLVDEMFAGLNTAEIDDAIKLVKEIS